jgi:cobalt/nickel transport system permease protein
LLHGHSRGRLCHMGSSDSFRMHHNYIDCFAQGDSPVHRLDARVKLVVALAYSAVLISFNRYAVGELWPMLIGPMAWLWIGGVPLGFVLRRLVVLSPFIAMLCLMSPLYDRPTHEAALGPWHFAVAGGWLTAADVGLKFSFGVMALTALMCTTPFSALLEAMRRFGAPRILAMQLGVLYRYVFVLVDEAMRIRRARDFRGAARAPAGRRLAAVGGVIGSLFVRSLERSERVHAAMCARGYTGRAHGLRQLRLRWPDAAFTAGAGAYLVLCRWVYPAML